MTGSKAFWDPMTIGAAPLGEPTKCNFKVGFVMSVGLKARKTRMGCDFGRGMAGAVART